MYYINIISVKILLEHVSPKTAVQNTNTVSPAPVKQNINEIPLSFLQNTVEEKFRPNK